MKNLAALTWGALLLASPFALACALPGDRFSDTKAAARAKGFKPQCTISEMSGAPFCTVSGKYEGGDFTYTFHDDAEHIGYSERIWYNVTSFRFLARHDPRVRGLIAAVYNDAVAQDFLRAKAVATAGEYQLPESHITFRRGRKYGYATGEGGGFTITLYRISDLNREIAAAKKCATMECGD